MHCHTRSIVSKLCAYCPSQVEAVELQIERIRRWLVLGCVLIKKHVRLEKTFEEEIRTGLITQGEADHFTEAITSVSEVDGKKDTYPSRNRPALVFHMLHQATTDLYKQGHFPSFNHHLGIENDLTALSNVFEEVEYLGCTIIPLPYAQLTRIVSLFYVITLPFGTAHELKWFTIPLTLALSLIYFVVDECASEMETPFEGRENDVDIEKMIRCEQLLSPCLPSSVLPLLTDPATPLLPVEYCSPATPLLIPCCSSTGDDTRRIDKHTSSLFSTFLGRPAKNYDIYSKMLKTKAPHDQFGEETQSRQSSASTLYELERRDPNASCTMAAAAATVGTGMRALHSSIQQQGRAYTPPTRTLSPRPHISTFPHARLSASPHVCGSIPPYAIAPAFLCYCRLHLCLLAHSFRRDHEEMQLHTTLHLQAPTWPASLSTVARLCAGGWAAPAVECVGCGVGCSKAPVPRIEREEHRCRGAPRAAGRSRSAQGSSFPKRHRPEGNRYAAARPLHLPCLVT